MPFLRIQPPLRWSNNCDYLSLAPPPLPALTPCEIQSSAASRALANELLEACVFRLKYEKKTEGLDLRLAT